MKVRLIPRTLDAKLRRAQEERADALRRHEDLQRYPRTPGLPALSVRKLAARR
jgi:hypothetical protein